VSAARFRRPSPSLAVIVTIMIVTLAFGWVDGSAGPRDYLLPDAYGFAHAGSLMLSGNWRSTYGSAWVQAGPLELGLTALASMAGGGQRGFAIILDLASMAAITAVAVTLLRRKPAALALFAVGAFLVRLPRAGYEGHPAELIIAALWLLAARSARRGQTTRAGALIGLSGCFELFGLLGVTVLALTPRLRRSVPGFALAGGLPIASFLPFVAAGHFEMFEFHWDAMSGIPRLMLGYEHDYTWPMRLGEGAIVVLAGVLCARFARRLPESVWIVPATTLLVRIAMDPISPSYYWDAPLAFVLIGGAGVAVSHRELKTRLAARFPSLAVAGQNRIRG
jgi:hypothetical protein